MTTKARRFVAFVLGVSTMVVMSGFLLVAAPPQAVGTWEVVGTTDPSSARSGAATATLADGSTFVAGGRLGDGTVTDGVVVYDPLSNASTTVGHLLSPRVNAAAARLDDGRVLVVGGEVGALLTADVEIFDPSTGTSIIAGAMAQPRTQHAAARLADGRVLIVGGETVDHVALASTEVFDPETFGMLQAGSMAVPRVGATATLLIDNRVLVVGGHSGNGMPDLASAELYQPFWNEFMPVDTQLSVARSGHTATLLPHNGAVLVAGGTAAGVPVTDVDLFLPAMFPDPYSWGMGSFAPAAPLAGARSHAVAGPAGNDGYAYVAGGGVPVGEAYAFVTLKTDKDDYAPGELALITGSGWHPGEDVELVFQEDPAVHPDYKLTLTADDDGNISHDEWAPEEHDVNVRFYLMATGKLSHRRAQMTFTDALQTNTVLVSSANPSIVGNSVTFTATVRLGSTAGSGTVVTVGTLSFGTGNNCTGGFTAFSPSSTGLTLNASGQASYAHTFTVPTPAGSPLAILACYNGTGGGTGTQNSDGTLSQTVNPATGPTKLAITSVNSGVNPTYGDSFSVVVQSQNTSSAATNVAANTSFSFTVATGTGTLTGTVSGTILAGQSSTTVTGVTYSKAENGVSLTATRTSGDTLTAGTSALFNVLKRSVTVTPDPGQFKVYGTVADPTLTYGHTPALVAGDSFTGALARDPGVNVGLYNITQGDLALSSNYTLNFTSGVQFEIKTLTVTVTPDPGQFKVYGTVADPALTYGHTPALVAGDSFTGALARDPGTNAGFYNITQGDLALSSNYTLNFTSGVQFEIETLTVTVTPDPGQFKVYGTVADPALTYGHTPALVAGDSFTGALARDPGTNAGFYNITQGDLALSSNYTLTFVTGVKFEIKKLALTVTAVTDTKPYDGDTSSVGVPTFSPALVGTDTPGFTQSFDNRNAGVGKTLTPAGVVNDGNSGNNYSYTYTPVATGEIIKRAVTVTAVAETKPYDGNTSSAGVPTFSPALITPDAPLFTQTFDNRNAGVGKTLTPAGVVNDGNSGNNYSYTYTPVTTGAITQRGVTVTAVTDTKFYDGDASSVGVPTFSPALIAPDSPSFTQSFDNENAGIGKTLTPAGLVSDGNSGLNYSYTYTPVSTGTINKKPITVTAVADSKIWDGNTSSTGIPTIAPGLATGDTPNFIQTFDTQFVGTGKTLTPSGTVNDGNSGNNYLVTPVSVNTGVITTGFCFNGFLSPIGGAVENAPSNGGTYADPVRSFKLGSTIPVKFLLNSLSGSGCGGLVTTGIHTLQATFYSSVTDSEQAIDATPTDAATTGNQFRLTGTEWHFNLSTKGGFKAGTWELKATLQDGSTKTVWISVKK